MTVWELINVLKKFDPDLPVTIDVSQDISKIVPIEKVVKQQVYVWEGEACYRDKEYWKFWYKKSEKKPVTVIVLDQF